MKISCISVLVFAVSLSAGSALAQVDDTARYPSKPVHLVIPFAPGGGNDILGRFVGQKLSERMGQPFVADNRIGGDGIIGTDFVAKSPADGYTLVVASSSYTTNAAVHKLPFDPVKSLMAIALLGKGPIIIAVSPATGITSLKELIAQAKAKPGQLNYATSGVGGINNFSGELFNLQAGVRMVHVPYKSGAQQMTDVMSGHTEVLVSALAAALVQIRAGKIRLLAVGTDKRIALMPDIPTVVESGVSGYESSIWWGIMAPAGVPATIADRLNSEIAAVLRDPETVKRLANEAAEPVIMSRQAFGSLIVSDIAKWTKIAREADIKAE